MKVNKRDVVKILEDECLWYREILSLSLLQRESAINNSSLEKVSDIANKKETFINKIKEAESVLQNGLELFGEDIKIKLLVSEIKSTIMKVTLLEGECRKYLEQSKNQINNERMRLSKGRKITKGYGGTRQIKKGLLSIKK